MLPHQIVTMLKNGRLLIAESVNEVTVLFCELDVDTSKYPAEKVVAILNIIFSAFDALVDERFVRKIETVACVWLGVSSPFLQSESPNEATRHAIFVAELALGMVGAMPAARERIRQEVGVNPDEIGMRMGLNSGPVAAGIVGIKNPR
jgi:adenylate cyclase